MNEPEYVGSKIFGKIATDNRVNKELKDCLYCEVRTTLAGDVQSSNAEPEKLPYKIPLNDTSKIAKQCPACKRIYLMEDPF
jgi:hypothetical protein